MKGTKPGTAAGLAGAVLVGLAACEAADSSPVRAPAPVTQVSGVADGGHSEKLAFSRDGRWLASSEGSELVLRSVGTEVTEAVRVSLGEDRGIALDFAGTDRLVLLVAAGPGIVHLRQFSLPSGQEGKRLPLFGLSPTSLSAQPSAPRVALAPVPPVGWNPRNPDEKAFGAVVYDLDSGLPVGGAGPLSSSVETRSLAWRGDLLTAVSLGGIKRWTPALREREVVRNFPEWVDVNAFFWVEGDDPLLALVRWPRVGWLAETGLQTVALAEKDTALFQVAPAWGGRAVAVLVSQSGGKVTGASLKVVARGGVEASWPLPWPLLGVAAHPSLPLLAWQDGEGAVHLLRLRDGRSVGVGEVL